MNSVEFPDWAQTLFTPKRYKIYYGGRGAGRSWAISRWLILEAAREKKRILCTRELQVSIKDSVHKLIADQIEKMGLNDMFDVGESFIRSKTGSEFIFKGLKHNINEIKSLEGIDIVWLEEAQSTSNKSFDTLLPTIRKAGSEIVMSFNPENEDDPVYQRFVAKPPPDAIVRKISYKDNPWFTEELENLRAYTQSHDKNGYAHIWDGEFKQIVEGQIYGSEMQQAVKDNRICPVPYNPSFPVITAWDLGFGDSTAIWFGQLVGKEPRMIDYYENSMKGLDHYVEVVKQRGYYYEQHVLPHDAGHASLRTGTTLVSQLESMGLGIRQSTITVLPVDAIETGIQLVRQLLPQLWFDDKRCEDGIRYLKKYHYEYDEDRRAFKNKPRHDYTSHCADAMRYFATYLKTKKSIVEFMPPGYSRQVKAFR